MKKTILLSVILLLGVFTFSEAQINLGKLKDKAKEKTSKMGDDSKKTNSTQTNSVNNSSMDNSSVTDGQVSDEGKDNQVFNTSFHKKNEGKIFFSKLPIVIGKEDPNQFTTKFTCNDNIYAIVYLAGKIEQLCGTKGEYELRIDGKMDRITYTQNPEDLEKNVYPIEVIPSPDKAIHGRDCIEFARIITNLSPTKHSFKIIFIGNYTELAAGEITLDLTGMDVAKINANAENASKKAKENYDNNRQLPESFSKNGTKYIEPELNENALRTVIMNDWKNCAQILKIVYSANNTNDEWMIHKNNYDIPTHKETRDAFGVIYKGKDGWCYYVETISFKKDYLGGGNYAKATKFFESAHIRIDCSKCQ